MTSASISISRATTLAALWIPVSTWVRQVTVGKLVLEFVGRGGPLPGPPVLLVGDTVVSAIHPDQSAGEASQVTVMPRWSDALQQLC